MATTEAPERQQRSRGPTRDAGVMVRLTRSERERLHAFARRHDLFTTQALRRLITNALAEEAREGDARP